jgi:hypothetical protein
MDHKKILAVLSVLFIISLFITYWYLPSDSRDYVIISSAPDKENTTVLTEAKQFYPSMRFAYKDISYEIDEECNLKKQNDVIGAFDIIEQKTNLNFYRAYNGQINVSCDEKTKMEGDLMIVGEGGPINVSIGKYFSIIGGGQILLIKDSNCPKPNLDMHEILHVLGFDHSQNSKSVMYSILDCDQEIDQVYIDKINYLYSSPSFPDLEIENLEASFSNRFLDYNLTIQNEGLADAGASYLDVYADDKKIDEIKIEPLKPGYGEKLTMSNFMVSKITFSSIKFVVRTGYEELNKENNHAVLEIKR